jgi:hypothetical protein
VLVENELSGCHTKQQTYPNFKSSIFGADRIETIPTVIAASLILSPLILHSYCELTSLDVSLSAYLSSRAITSRLDVVMNDKLWR